MSKDLKEHLKKEYCTKGIVKLKVVFDKGNTHRTSLEEPREAEVMGKKSESPEKDNSEEDTLNIKDFKHRVAEVREVIYENQRRGLFGGFSASSLLPLVDKRGQWSWKDGTPCEGGLDNLRLTPGWEWIDNWKYTVSAKYDRDGWQYAFSFWDSNWSSEPQPQTFVRKRKWTRNRRMIVDPKRAEESIKKAQQDQDLSESVRHSLPTIIESKLTLANNYTLTIAVTLLLLVTSIVLQIYIIHRI
ncbi:uncharacterized protein LOC135120924 [Zophobas morio]|uniref:uncharacterized protein LOC135120924 n=1 Tax=Zophobas morio TaxID=2755281 RepID=UPI0030838D20